MSKFIDSTKECCGNCRFYSDGACLRYPPTPVPTVFSTGDYEMTGVGSDVEYYFAKVAETQWCGEWTRDTRA